MHYFKQIISEIGIRRTRILCDMCDSFIFYGVELLLKFRILFPSVFIYTVISILVNFQQISDRILLRTYFWSSKLKDL